MGFAKRFLVRGPMSAEIHDISTLRARDRQARLQEKTRPCPWCDKVLPRIHIMFDVKNYPDLPYSKWVYICGDCHFMGYLTGDKSRDLHARNLYEVMQRDEEP